MKEFKGALPALVTPLNEDGSINENALKKLIDYLLAQGVNGLYLGGSTGEGLILPPETRKKLVEIVRDYVDDEYLVIAHIGAIDTKSVLDLAEHADKVGVDAISAVPPFYYSLDLQGIKENYQRISQVSNTPMLLYNIPGATGVNVDATMMGELLQIDNVIGLKYTDYNLFEMSKIKQIKKDVKIFYGCDEMVLSGLSMGADGCIGTFQNVIPGHFVKLYNLVNEGRIGEARQIQYQINKIIDVCLNYRAAMAGIKEMLSMIGFNVGKVTPPLRALTPAETDQLKDELEEAGFFDMVKLIS